MIKNNVSRQQMLDILLNVGDVSHEDATFFAYTVVGVGDRDVVAFTSALA